MNVARISSQGITLDDAVASREDILLEFNLRNCGVPTARD